MATTGFAEKAARRRKLLTVVVFAALGVTTLGVGVAYWTGLVRKEPAAPVPQSLPANVHQQLSGYTFTRSDGGRRIFTVHAARTVAFNEGGATVLEDVLVELFGRTGSRLDLLRTPRCKYNPETGDFSGTGRVQIDLDAQANNPSGAEPQGKPSAHLETASVSFRHQGSQAVTDEPVQFRIGPASGTARGMVYATADGWVELRQDVVAELQPKGGTSPQTPIRLTAARLRYDKASSLVTLWGPLEITQGMRRATGERGRVSLDKRYRVSEIVLEDNAKAMDSSGGRALSVQAQRIRGEFAAASGELHRLVAETSVIGEWEEPGSTNRLQANELELNFLGRQPKPQGGTATGGVQLVLESSKGPGLIGVGQNGAGIERDTLTAAQIKFALRPKEITLSEAETVGPGKLVVVPADPKIGARIITAGEFLMAFDARGRLEKMRGLSPTRVVFEPPKNAAPESVAQESSADRLEAVFDPATQTLREARQIGHYRFQDGDRQASAEQADYVAQSDSLTLVGHPEVWDPHSRVKSEHLNFDLRSDTAEAEGKVQATQLQSPGPAEGGPPAEPTSVLADRMTAQQRSQFMRYEGHVRAWRGSDVVESSSLDVYRAERRMSGGTDVLTSYLQPASLVGKTGSSQPSGQPRTGPVRVGADLLDYLDQGRKASYRGHVRLRTENTTLEADRMEVFFSSQPSPQDPEVERAVAEGHVHVTQPGRRAQGERGEYFAEPGKIILTGGPPVLEDTDKGNTTGQRLTFFIHDDRLLVDGGDGQPSLTEHRVAP